MSLLPATYETLAKTYIYTFDQPDFFLSNNQILAENELQIDQIFENPETGLVALGLVSKNPNNPPVLVFRGNDFANDDQAWSNSPEIGFVQFSGNQEEISRWLKKTKEDSQGNPQGLAADIIGHSLGGALAQITGVQLPEITGDIMTFNAPGISSESAISFTKNGLNQGKSVTHYLVSGDFVSLLGEALLPGTVILQIVERSNEINPLVILNKNRLTDLLTDSAPTVVEKILSTTEVNQSNFTFADGDYYTFIEALSFFKPQLANHLKSRGNAETFRQSPEFSYEKLVQEIQQTLAPTQANYLVGNLADNTANSGGGNDTLLGNDGDDTLKGGENDDWIEGERGDDQLFGGLNPDTLLGGEGQDTLYGGRHDDRLDGGLDNDFLRGDLGNDSLIGNEGSDTFFLAKGKGTDSLIDFQVNEDFLGLAGSLTSAQLTISSTPTGTEIIISETGEILAQLSGVSFSSLNSFNFVRF